MRVRRPLAAAGQTRERRRQATHPARVKRPGRDCAQPGVVVGHQQAARPGEVDLGVTKSHSGRAASATTLTEANFKTLKSWPAFLNGWAASRTPAPSAAGLHALQQVHRHSAIGLLIPSDIHHGRGPKVRAARAPSWPAPPTTAPPLRPQVPQVAGLRAPAWINKPEPGPR